MFCYQRNHLECAVIDLFYTFCENSNNLGFVFAKDKRILACTRPMQKDDFWLVEKLESCFLKRAKKIDERFAEMGV